MIPGAVGCAPKDDGILKIAAIGINGMGFSDLQAFLRQPNVECVALCDIDQSVLNKRAGQVEEKGGKKPELFTDWRKLLERKDIDAVYIATPNHWHALLAVWACQAGKDVYVEKPVSYSIWEGRKMIEAARKYNRIVQVGMQSRSAAYLR